MKKYFLLAIATAAWQYEHEFRTQLGLYESPATANSSVPIQFADYACDGRQYCNQMRSRAEAEFFVRNCPNTKMDGDNDGVPCETDTRF